MSSPIRRRDFGRLVVGTSGAFGLHSTLRGHDQLNSTVKGVRLGVQTYSFRDRPLDATIEAIKQLRIGTCELWSGHIEPLRETRRSEDGRAKLRSFRLETPLSHFEKIGTLFHEAGIDLHAYNYSFRDDFTDDEIARGFEIAKALGAKVITASGTVSVAARVNPHAKRYNMRVGMHNHSRIRENEFATPADFAKASEDHSHIAVNLDIGHFVAAGFDPVEYIRQHHGRIVTLHIKDRKKEQGENMPFGEGDTPIADVLTLLSENGFDMPANIEYEYKGADSLAEVRKCIEYCKQALGA
ncbi:MAG: sugar phosphate isomerase/epimerase [Bryobacterales bacterium]|nr:sugar phosphate isomerase/epimerase [Bryobacterales bacterium]